MSHEIPDSQRPLGPLTPEKRREECKKAVEWTAEPWEADERGYVGYTIPADLGPEPQPEEWVFVGCFETLDGKPHIGNAERAVACVNALEGIQNPSGIADVVEAARLYFVTLNNPPSVDSMMDPERREWESMLATDLDALRTALARLDDTKEG